MQKNRKIRINMGWEIQRTSSRTENSFGGQK